MATQTAHSAICVTQTLRELLKIMNFPEIPEEAKYIAFFDDGEAVFLTDVQMTGFALPRLLFVSTSIHKNVEVEIDD